MQAWSAFLAAYRAQDWESCDMLLRYVQRQQPGQRFHALYAARVEQRRRCPPDPAWDGAHTFDSK